MAEFTDPDFYEENEAAEIVVTGHSRDGYSAIFDARQNEGVFFRTREEAVFAYEALGRFLGRSEND